MTSITNRLPVSISGVSFAPGFLGNLATRVTSYVDRSRAARQLAALDDRMLDDIGVSRGEIHSHVWGR
jgi:uncharacterized protein YjiS (DUF1127 family)